MPKDAVLKTWNEKIDDGFALLVRCFREVLEEVGEPDLVQALDVLAGHKNAMASRGKDPVDRELQVMSIAFQLLNLVEENAAVEARRTGETANGLLHEPGLWGQQLRKLLDMGFGIEHMGAAIARTHVEIVLTAHPTEAKRPLVLKQHRALFDNLQRLENTHWTERERSAIRKRIKVILERLWRTGEIYLQKPGIDSELTHMLDYFRMVFPAVLPRLDQDLRDAWSAAGLPAECLQDNAALPRITFGNWVGGDRDGHPFVTAAVTERTLSRLRETAVQILDQHLLVLYDRMGMSVLFQDPPEALRAILQERRHLLGEPAEAVMDLTPQEPWRQFVGLMRLCLPGAGASWRYEHSGQLASDLRLLHQSLCDLGAQRLAVEDVAPVERAVECFGFHAAVLDIRQNSGFHDRALEQLLWAAGIDADGYATWPEDRRCDLLRQELASLRPLVHPQAPLPAEARELVDTYRVVAKHIQQFGSEGIGSFIVSMTRGLSDLLAVYVFAREAGLLYRTDSALASRIAVVPLFESTEDLVRAPAIMEAFFAEPLVRESLRVASRPLQQVMVGYSDSNKGSGLFSSQWRVNQAQQALSAIAAAAGADLVFFHGRGGTFSRGAGPTHRFLQALPEGSLQGSFRMTEQGETIAQKYGNAPTAEYNLELLLAGVAATTLRHERPAGTDARLLEIGERLAAFSQQSYEALLESDGFLAFWAEATPIDALEHSYIGSRPARRTGRRSMQDLRAIPWVFSWIQSRYYLTGWYGIGAALHALQQDAPADFAFLCDHVGKWPFLRYILTNAETSLASADADIMRAYAGLVQDEVVRSRFLERILTEFHLTEEMINTAFGAPRAQRRPRMMKTLELREAGLRALHARQIQLLREWRGLQASDEKEAVRLLPSLLLSVNAIASGQRVTG